MLGDSLLATSCASDDGSPSRGSYAGSAGNGNDASAGTGGSSGTSGGGARDGGGAGNAGTGGHTEAGSCGDGVKSFGEPCDEGDFGGQTCQTFGFDSGVLSCRNCSLVLSACTGDENCTDGNDNDFDGNVDCGDSDCTAASSHSCSAFETLPDPALVVGETSGHASELTPTCTGSGGPSGAELVYPITARTTGVLEATLRSSFSANLSISLRKICSDGASESGCGERTAALNGVERLVTPVKAGDKLYVVVDGTGAGQAGGFTLDVRSRAVACGDANRDPGEACDDGNKRANDGCSAACTLESDEIESNDTPALASPYTSFPFHAAIATPSDVDVFSVTVSKANSTLVTETFDLGDGACSKLLLDSKLEILGADGATVLAKNGDTGGTFCSRTEAAGLGAGKYYVRVSSEGTEPTFPYVLNVNVTN